MLFFTARVVRHPAMQSPTLVVLTGRNDLDDQLFGQFQRCADVLDQTPVQAMQAIARVNHVFRDKPGDLMVTTSASLINSRRR